MLPNSLFGIWLEKWEKMTSEESLFWHLNQKSPPSLSQTFFTSAAALLLWEPWQFRGTELPPLGVEINTDSHTAGISLFKKILLTPRLVGGSCRLVFFSKTPLYLVPVHTFHQTYASSVVLYSVNRHLSC